MMFSSRLALAAVPGGAPTLWGFAFFKNLRYFFGATLSLSFINLT